jgi:hypothetical protein
MYKGVSSEPYYDRKGFVMVEPRLVSDLTMGFGIGRPKIGVGSVRARCQSAGRSVSGVLWLCGSRNVAAWSKEIHTGRAKTARGAGGVPRKLTCGFTVVEMTAVGSAGILGSRAKVSVGCVMLVRSRQITYRYVVIDIGRSVDHYGLFSFVFFNLENIAPRGFDGVE